ncbi:DUF3221 domain-containing protein [Alkalihalobacillus sp. LMS39]|uniref:DUF3221 domain-containing protein n=1 Tax=Alkalihalobacillus sp. LMS39 TaxID=2924032 RepID=UPI001FB1BDB7|nr:DUF3221 domain-containing protein [Alkalihalobacillus sp. LMS39]UOE95783.1 YobA family protein [Alkalihalobacillus sp. LMS39]
MKKKNIVILLVSCLSLFLFIFVFFNNQTFGKTYEGYIVEIKDNRLLVVNDVNVNVEEWSIGDYEAKIEKLIWFYVEEDITQYEVGEKVKIIAGDGMETSLPPHADAVDIKKIS